MERQLQSTSSVVIHAPLVKVWAYNMDITKLLEYHPRTEEVNYLSGKTIREPGVEYQCVIHQGPEKGSCLERITEVLPMSRFTTVIPSDTWGLSDLFDQIEAITLFETLSDTRTKMTIEIYFSPKTDTAIALLPAAKEKFQLQTQETLQAIKTMIEKETSSHYE